MLGYTVGLGYQMADSIQEQAVRRHTNRFLKPSQRVTKHQEEPHREAVNSPPLEVFISRLDTFQEDIASSNANYRVQHSSKGVKFYGYLMQKVRRCNPRFILASVWL